MMKKKSIWSLLFMFFVLVGCKNAKNVDLATKAMERARAAEAEYYAPKEYKVAQIVFKKMNIALSKGDKESANIIAQDVVEKANIATDVARKNKAVQTIGKLKQQLALAQKLGVNESNPDVYNQATQSLIDAENFYGREDYERAISLAEGGLKILETVLGGQESLALANLNRARDLWNRASKSTDLSKTQSVLDDTAVMLDEASDLYQQAKYSDSIAISEKVISALECLMSNYPLDGQMSIFVNGEDNLQLQAYELIRRLGQTIEFIKKNKYLKPGDSGSVMDSKELDYIDDSNNMMLDDDDNDLAMLPIFSMQSECKAQNMGEIRRGEEVTLTMIEDLHTRAQQSYDIGNYLNAADLAREGLRLADLYLAGQTLTNHRVIRGDTLWDISAHIYSTPWLWPNIWRANKLQIKDPDLIYPNQVFRIPPAPLPIK